MYSVLYFGLMLIIAFLIGYKRKKIGLDGAYVGVLVGFFINYALVPFILQSNADFYKSQTWWTYWYINRHIFSSKITDLNILLSIFCTLLGLVAFNVGYNTKICFNKTNQKSYISPERVDNNYDIKNLSRIVLRLAIMVLAVCTAMLMLYISAFGGLNRAFSMADRLRSHTESIMNYGIAGVYSYIFLICGFLPLSFCFFWYVYVNDKRISHFLLLLLSGVMTFIYLRLNSGKSGFIRFGIILAYIIVGKKIRKRFWIFVLVGGIISLPLLDVLDSWFSGQDLIQASNQIDIRSNVVAFESATELNYNLMEITRTYGYQYFEHYIIDFLDVLPGLSFETSWEGVSEFVRGADWAMRGGTPNDIITYGFLQFNVLGVFIHLFVSGQVARWVDKSVSLFKDERLRSLVSISFCSNFISYVSCSDIASTFLHNLFFTGLILFMIYINKIRKRNSSIT